MTTMSSFLLAVLLIAAVGADDPALGEQSSPPSATESNVADAQDRPAKRVKDGSGLMFQFGAANEFGSLDLGYLGRIEDGHQFGGSFQLAGGRDVQDYRSWGLRFIYRRALDRRAGFYAELSPGLNFVSPLHERHAQRHPAWFGSAEIGHNSWLAIFFRYDHRRFVWTSFLDETWHDPGIPVHHDHWSGSWSVGVKVRGWKGLAALCACVVIGIACGVDEMSGADYGSLGSFGP